MGINVERAILRFFNTTTNKHFYQVYEASQTELEILKGEFIEAAIKVREFKELPIAEMREQATRTLNFQACRYCAFAYPCKLEAQGKSATKTLANEYAENDYGYVWETDS
jgi:hypothetical protein